MNERIINCRSCLVEFQEADANARGLFFSLVSNESSKQVDTSMGAFEPTTYSQRRGIEGQMLN
jgi:hypothetical protein